MNQNPIKDPRPAANLRIKFRSENLQQFIERYSTDVSRGGIFIRTREPLPVGTPLKLDFQYQSGAGLIAGEGTVVWVREFDPSRSNVPPGMGVRFDKLSAESQTILEQILVEKARRDGVAVPGAPRATRSGMPAVQPPPPPARPLPTPTSGTAGGVVGPPAREVPEGGAPGAPAAVGDVTTAARPAEGTAAEMTSAETTRKITTGARPPEGRGAPVADDSDELDEEPTQIASGLPNFFAQGPAVESGPTVRLPGVAPAGAATPGTSGAPEIAASPASPASAGAPIQADPEAAAKAPASIELATSSLGGVTGASAVSHLPDEPRQPAVSPSASQKEPAVPVEDAGRRTPTSGGNAARVPAADLEPSLAAVFSPRPKPAETVPEASATAPAAAAPAGPTAAPASPTSPAAASPSGPVPSPPSGAGARGVRVPASLIAVTILALAATSYFVVKFFNSQATESLPAAQHSIPEPGATAGPEPGSATPPTGVTAPAPAGPAAEPPGAGAPAAPPAPAADSPGGAEGSRPASGLTPGDPGSAKAPPAAAPPAPPTTEPPAKSPVTVAPKRRPRATPRVTEAKVAAAANAGPQGETGESARSSSDDPSNGIPGGTEGVAPAAEGPGATIYQLKITSKPPAADVSVDGQVVGRTPYSGSLPDLSAPHVIALKKDGFEAFEQTVTGTSGWTKTKGTKGGPTVQQLKIGPKLRALNTAAERKPEAAGSRGPEGTPAGEPPDRANEGAPPPAPQPASPADGTQ